jgi:hypothetical protein
MELQAHHDGLFVRSCGEGAAGVVPLGFLEGL